MYSDENDGEPRGDVVNYALMDNTDIKLSSYKNACTNHLWINDMEDKIISIKRMTHGC